MQNKIVALEKLLPEFSQMFKMRYVILQKILQKGTVGRRTLVQELELSERMVRAEVEKLEEQGLIHISVKGMSITTLGEEVLSSLYMPYHLMDELSRLEEEVATALGLKKAIIVKGNFGEDNEVVNSLGLAFGSLLEELLKEDMTLAITGGTTIAKMVDHMPSISHSFNGLHVLPARGSVGERVELHANTIAVAITGGTTIAKMVDHMPSISHSFNGLHVLPARGSVGERVELHANTIAVKLANRLNAKYEVLNIPDNLSNQSIHFIKNEPQIENLLKKLSETDMIIFGIGNAMKMAKHRKETQAVLELLEERRAISESFRHYFNAEGEVVYDSEVIGVSPVMAMKIPYRIAVAGGKEKVLAILASKILLEDSYLILDESAARTILSVVQKS